MIILPAIDIIDGEAVRLTRGDFESKKKYSGNPVETALIWKEKGAQWLHIVDLDGAKYGKCKNLQIAVQIKEKTGLKVEYGGGIRDMQMLTEVLSTGIDRAILGTKVLEDRALLRKANSMFGNRLIVSLDFSSSGIIYKDGWQKETELNIFEHAASLKSEGISEIIITNISRDGTLSGPDIGLIEKVLQKSRLNLIIAGGITTADDIRKLKDLNNPAITGVIIGKALYEGTISLEEAILAAEGQALKGDG
jgi:phosphoribosylformimino-5-aminoimidazole carboxamide ribotide isomerase